MKRSSLTGHLSSFFCVAKITVITWGVADCASVCNIQIVEFEKFCWVDYLTRECCGLLGKIIVGYWVKDAKRCFGSGDDGWDSTEIISRLAEDDVGSDTEKWCVQQAIELLNNEFSLGDLANSTVLSYTTLHCWRKELWILWKIISHQYSIVMMMVRSFKKIRGCYSFTVFYLTKFFPPKWMVCFFSSGDHRSQMRSWCDSWWTNSVWICSTPKRLSVVKILNFQEYSPAFHLARIEELQNRIRRRRIFLWVDISFSSMNIRT